jgi:hypothetical protein
MDQDVVIQLLTRGLVFLGVAVAFTLFATWFVGWVCRRAKVGPGLTLAAQVLTPIALFYGLSLYLDVAGHVVQARVTSTEERITYASSGRSIPGSWTRSFWASVTFDTPDAPGMAPLWLDEASYDTLMPGMSIAVRYLAWLPFIARPANQSTLSLVPWRWLGAGFIILGVILTLRPLSRRVPGWLTALAILSCIIALVLWFVFPTPWVNPLDPPVLTTTAEVLRVREETRSFTSGRTTGTVRAPQPWNVVELRFIPQGRTKPVVAVDSVDVGSVAGLQIGARLPVSYNASNPRDARLNGARTWRWKEWRELAELAVWGLITVVGLMLLGKAVGAWWRRLTARHTDRTPR